MLSRSVFRTAVWCASVWWLTACGGGASSNDSMTLPMEAQAGARALSVTSGGPTLSDAGVTSAMPGVSRLALAPQGQTVVALSAWPAEASVIDLATHRTLRRLRLLPHSLPVGATFLSNGTHLVVVGRDSVAQVWNLAQGTLDFQLRGHAQPLRALASHPQGSRLATVGDDSRLLVWDTTQGRLVSVWPSGSERVASLAYSADGRRLVLAGGSSQVRILDAQDGRLIQLLSTFGSEVTLAVLSPDGRWLAGVQPAGRVTLWSQDPQASQKGQFLPTPALQFLSPGVRALAFSADSRSAISGGDDGVLRWWDLASGRLLRTYSDGTSPINVLTFAPQSDRTVMTGLQDHRIVFWDLITGEKDVTFHAAAPDR